MATIFDNIELDFVSGLQRNISAEGVKRADFCVGYFNLRGWDLVINEVGELPGDYVSEGEYYTDRKLRKCRLLIGMHRPNEELVRMLYSKEQRPVDNKEVIRCRLEIARDFKKQLLLGLPTKEDEQTLRRLSGQLKDGTVCVKLYLKTPLHAKLYLTYRPVDDPTPVLALMGSSNLTYSGLTGNGELNAEIGDSDNAKKLAKWFDERWNDNFCLDITQDLIEVIDNSWAGEEDIPPYYIYLKTAYHLSEDARNGLKEFSLPPVFQNELFDFQQTAAKLAAKYLNNEKRGGAMIGDVVGLGKTITACAVAKMFENTYGSSTLIICPANLQDMWDKYRKKYDLKADIISMAKQIDADNSRYYRLIIVDESHNLRNSEGKRYQNIRELIQKQNCKVLLLTATPYNKDYRDLSSQLRLFLDDDADLGIRPEKYIEDIGGEYKFSEKHEDFIRSIKAFERSYCPEDWQDLMKLFLIRRTRTFIKRNYAKFDKEKNRYYLEFPNHRSYFPNRIPKAIKFENTENDQFSKMFSDKMIDIMETLKLPRYCLSMYLKPDAKNDANDTENKILDNLARAGYRMLGFCLSTFFKRMDSCGFSFLITIFRHILRNAVFIYALDNKLKLPIGDENNFPEDFLDEQDMNDIFHDDDKEEEAMSGNNLISIPSDLETYMQKAESYYNSLSGKSNIKWLSSRFFKKTLKQALIEDCKKLIQMINLCGSWNTKTDKKLNHLEELITKTHSKEKILIFTQYSDTANYLYNQLKKRGLEQIGKTTGDTQDTNKIVERFSPVSNKVNIDKSSELRILVSTDVLSEGQNLQDCHIVVNYDLPWAIIRLIQRAGRVDRIDQTAEDVYCYSFFPADGIEQIIKLQGRLNNRINNNAKVIGSDELFFEGNQQNLTDMYNEKAGILDENNDDDDIDIASQAYQIWKKATDDNPKLKEIIPALSNMIYTTKKTDDAKKSGVITYARTYNDFDVLTWLAPDGKVISQSQNRILNAMECSIDEPSVETLDNHFDLVEEAVSAIKSQNTSFAGSIGTRFSTKRKIYDKLNHAIENKEIDLFFTEEKRNTLRLIIDQIYNYPLKESSRVLLGRMLRNNDEETVIDTIIEMYQKQELCKIDDENMNSKEPEIICSMGINKINN